MRTALDIAPLSRRRRGGLMAPGGCARRLFERRPAQAARSLLSPPLCFPYAATPNAEWISYALFAQQRAVNVEALRHG